MHIVMGILFSIHQTMLLTPCLYQNQYTTNPMNLGLFAVIMRFDSLRDIEAAMTAEVRKLHHIGMEKVPRRSTLSDANARRSEKFFEEVYRDLYGRNKDLLSSDSRRNGCEEWIKRLRIIDSTTISLFSNAIFKGVGRHPKTGKKKGGIKVHSVMHANEGVPCDVRFTSAATNDSFMLAPSYCQHNEIVAMDRAYINYEKFEELTMRNVVYVTKMKKNLNHETLVDCMDMNSEGKMEYREQVVVFRRGGDKPHSPYHHIRGHQEWQTAQAHVPAYKRFRHVTGYHSGYLSQEMADRVALQADQTELPAALLLW